MELENNLKFELKCGRFNFDTTTRKVLPVPDKGLLRVFINLEGQKKLTWTNLDKNAEELDLYLFAGDAKFQQVPKQKSTFVLRFESFQQKYFFWSQETEIDSAKVVSEVERIIAYEPQPLPEYLQGSQLQQQSQSHSIAPTAQPAPSQLVATATTVSQQQSQSSQPAAQPGFSMDFIKNLQKKLQEANKHGPKQQKQLKPIHLSSIFTPSFLKFSEQNMTPEALSHLPEGQQKDQRDLMDNLRSPQFLQAVDALDDALNSEAALSLFYQMGLDTEQLRQYLGTEAFLRALEKWGKQQKNG